MPKKLLEPLFESDEKVCWELEEFYSSKEVKNVEIEKNKREHVQSSFNHGFMALGLPWRSTHICRHTYGYNDSYWGQKTFLLFKPILNTHSKE